jgi:cytochrome c
MPKTIAALAVAAALFASPAAFAAAMSLDITDGTTKMSGDPVHGKAIFARCGVCHSIDAGQNRIGPSLHGVVGRKAGSVSGFNYSTANKSSGIVWTEQRIFVYLKNPQAQGTGVPGTKMSFPGLPSPQDRADVIAYLKQNSN